MEARKEALRALKACRFCLARDGPLSSIYDKSRRKSPVPLPLQIMACVAIEVFPSDGMPAQICDRCEFFMGQCYQFKQVCRSADESLLQFMQCGDTPEPIDWPPKLLKTLKLTKSPREIKVERVVKVNTAMEVDGEEEAEEEEEAEGTVQVRVSTASESDDDEDVLNIKIETGSGENAGAGGEPARIKVTQRDGRLHITEEADDAPPADGEEMEEDEVEGNDKFPCGECDRTFPLRQMLLLHLKKDHRERTFTCPQCYQKFFSKYDLNTHLTTHSDEMPFECVACSRQFKRYTLLKRHEKAKHADRSNYLCKMCPATFLSLEELQAHTYRHRQYDKRPYKCTHCTKRFLNKTALERHTQLLHGKQQPFACNYCPQKFSTAPRLARHVKTHAGIRPYPCKFCPKTFIKSHHYTRHLRMKHNRFVGTSPRGPFGAGDRYKCDLCDEVFHTQDLLIYHSAVHTTHNKTCPLCEEKFDTVEEVTAHIKSHADEAEQFLCDLCELVFTTEDRLDNHLYTRHADELRQPGEDPEEVVEMKYDVSQELPSLDDERAETTLISERESLQAASEESEAEVTYTELATVDTLNMALHHAAASAPAAAASTPAAAPATPPHTLVPKSEPVTPNTPTTRDNGTLPKTAGILRKAEEVKRRAEQQRALAASASPTRTAAASPARTTAASPARTAPASPARTAAAVASPARAAPPAPAKPPPAPAEATLVKLTPKKVPVQPSPQKITGTNLGLTGNSKVKSKEPRVEKEERKNQEAEHKKDREERREKVERKDKEGKKESEVKKAVQGKGGREEKKDNGQREKVERGETPSDKSLRLLERDLQELKRTSKPAAAAAAASAPRRGRPPNSSILGHARHKEMDGRKSLPTKGGAVGGARRRFGPASSSPSPSPSPAGASASAPRDRDRELREERKERKEAKETKDKDKESKASPVDTPRRSSRGTRRDYAKMIRNSRDESDSESEVSEAESDASPPPAPPPAARVPAAATATTNVGKRGRGRPPGMSRAAAAAITGSSPVAASPPAAASPAAALRRRARASPARSPATPAKRKKSMERKEDEDKKSNEESDKMSHPSTPAPASSVASAADASPTPAMRPAAADVLVSPSGQTLTKVSASVIKSLPPGVKPLPLPPKLKTAMSGTISEMKMGDKMVKVQKIVMTKAEVEAMSKKGMLEMKHGTMVLKQGFKLPPSGDAATIRNSLARVASEALPSSGPTESAPPPMPTRCDLPETEETT